MKRFLTSVSTVLAVCLGAFPGASFGKPGGHVNPSGAVVVQSVTGSLGFYLTDAEGRSLYMFEADGINVSNCYGECAVAWPPLLASSGQGVFAAGNAMGEFIGTTLRTDGTRQVTYNGMPLYYYARDRNPGDITGQGVYGSGALWYLVRPDGTKIRELLE